MRTKDLELYLFKKRAQQILSRGAYRPSILRGIITHGCLECGAFCVWTDQTTRSIEGDHHVRRMFYSDITCSRRRIPKLSSEIDVKNLMEEKNGFVIKLITSAYWTFKNVYNKRKSR